MLESTVGYDDQGKLVQKTEIAHVCANGMCNSAARGIERGELGHQLPKHLGRALYAEDGLAGLRYRYQDAPAATPQLEDGWTCLLGSEQVEIEVAVDPGKVLVVVLRLGTGVFFD